MGEKISIPNVEGHSFEGVYQNVFKNVVAFTKRYKTAYMWFYLQKIHQELDGKGGQQKWQLAQRKWESYNRPLKEGVLHVLADSSGKKWKKRYCVMQSDYTLEIYTSKEEYDKAAKPKLSTKYSGHEIVQSVDSFLRTKLQITSRDFGYVNHDISTFIKKVTLIGQSGKRPTQHIFCVAHDWRGTTYFAAETAIEKDHWIRILKDSVRHLEGAQCPDETAREAFTFALEQTIHMQGYFVPRGIVSGSFVEILTDLFSDCQSYECKEILLPEIKGGFAHRYKTWFFVMATLHTMTKSIVIKEFTDKRKELDADCESKRQDIIANLPQLNAAYETTSNAIKAVLYECFDQIVVGDILPRMPEVVGVMSDSLAIPLRASREQFLTLVEGVQKTVTSSGNQQFANNLDRYFLHTLDFAPRNPDFVCPMSDSMSSKKPAISLLENVFPRTDFTSHLNSIFTYQQTLLDTAVYTFETLCGEEVTRNDGKLTPSTIAKVRARVLKKLDYDIVLAQRRFFRAVIKSGTLEQTRESIEQTCKAKMLDFEATIPDDLSVYLPISTLFTDVLTKRFNELINPALTSCMRQLMSDSIGSFKFRSSSTLSSVSSYASVVDEDPNKITNRSSKTIIPRDSKEELAPHQEIQASTSSSSSYEAPPSLPQDDTGEQDVCLPGMDGETGETNKSRCPPRSRESFESLIKDENPSADVELGEQEVDAADNLHASSDASDEETSKDDEIDVPPAENGHLAEDEEFPSAIEDEPTFKDDEINVTPAENGHLAEDEELPSAIEDEPSCESVDVKIQHDSAFGGEHSKDEGSVSVAQDDGTPPDADLEQTTEDPTSDEVEAAARNGDQCESTLETAESCETQNDQITTCGSTSEKSDCGEVDDAEEIRTSYQANGDSGEAETSSHQESNSNEAIEKNLQGVANGKNGHPEPEKDHLLCNGDVPVQTNGLPKENHTVNGESLACNGIHSGQCNGQNMKLGEINGSVDIGATGEV